MFGFIKKVFLVTISFFSEIITIINPLKCVSMNNQKCRVGTDVVNVKSDKPVFFPFTIKTSKCSGACNNINDQHDKLYVPDIVKNIYLKVFNLMSRTNETKYVEWHKTSKYKCRLDASVCNSKQCWNNENCRCECKELINKGICDKGFIWNPINCECECDNSCDVGEYLDYANCKC